jgi:hypothetical protein
MQVTGEMQVAPRVKITIPRIELLAAVLSLRLARGLKEPLKMSIGKVGHFMNSSAVLGMLKI